MPGMKGMWLLVRISLPLPSTLLLLAHTYQVDIELGLQPVQSTPTTAEALESEEAVGSSALPAEHAGAVAEPEHTPVSIQNIELQSTQSTKVDAETSPSPSSAQGAQIGDNDLSNVDNGNAQPATLNLKSGEPLPAANDNHDPAGLH